MIFVNLILYVFFFYIFWYIFFKGTKKKDFFIVTNETKKIILASNCIGAFSFARRITGLLNHASLSNSEGLFISPARVIHVSGMKFSIDIIFLNKKGVVVNIFENIKPEITKILPSKINGGKGAYSVLELPLGTIKKTQTYIGDKITINEKKVD
jgi:uncharacterized membrane protein (UPF0127 family)